MKVVVFSDAHGALEIVENIIELNPDADYIISLGDHELPDDFLMNNDVVMIKGNSRIDAGFVYERELEINGFKLFLVHGHKYNVHKGLSKLGKYAITKEYDIVLYGHTHIVNQAKVGPVQFLNPGSCARPRNTLPPTYLILNITENEFTWEIKDSINNRTIEV